MNKENKQDIDIIKLSVEAREAKKLNSAVIDVTIGSLYDEDGTFLECHTFTEAINSLPPEDKYSYATMSGGKELQNNIEKWLFGSYLDSVKKQKELITFASMGGTGALSNLFRYYLPQSAPIILSNINWNNYYKMIDICNTPYITYELFNGDKFNLEGFIKCINQVKDQNKQVVTIINTPNHNPTGYTLSNSELMEVINYLNTLTDNQIILIIDVAYIDFMDHQESRAMLSLFKNTLDHVLPIIVFSGSKSFSAYGLRFGSMTFLTANQIAKDYIEKEQTILTRTIFSSPNKMAISAFNSIMSNEEIKNKYQQELLQAVTLLKKRANMLLKYLDQANIKYYPYHGGFFILLKVPAYKVFTILKKQGIYTIPEESGLRIAISSLKCKDILRLVNSIKSIIEEV